MVRSSWQRRGPTNLGWKLDAGQVPWEGGFWTESFRVLCHPQSVSVWSKLSPAWKSEFSGDCTTVRPQGHATGILQLEALLQRNPSIQSSRSLWCFEKGWRSLQYFSIFQWLLLPFCTDLQTWVLSGNWAIAMLSSPTAVCTFGLDKKHTLCSYWGL